MKKLLSLLTLLSLGFTGSAQCVWSSVYFESYEYTTVIPYLVPGKVFHDTPQTTALANCVRTGSRGVYMNIIDGQTGTLYSQPFTDICVGQNYRFKFSFNNASGTAPNPNLTFNVIDNNSVVVSTLTVAATNAWQDLTMPAFAATTTSLTFQIVTNITGAPGNDAGFDDLRMEQCQPQPILYTISQCAASQTIDLYDEQTSNVLSPAGVWTGPSTLTNGHLGTFTSPTNTNGIYNYTVDGAPGCADSIARFTVQLITTPSITAPAAPLTGCQNATLPAITGTNLTNAHYYTGTGGTGTVYNPGASIASSQSLFIYDGLTGCSDEETITITISTPNQAGTDGAIASCGQMGLFDLTTLLNAPFTAGGTWAETTSPASGQLSGSIFNTSSVTAGVDYTFTYTVPASGACPSDAASFTVAIGNVDDVNLGNDTTICQGTSLLLSPGTYDSYLWNNGSTNSTRTASAPGIYWVTVGTIADNATNVIINGDFESGAANFTTQYIPGPGGTYGPLSDPGTYAITSSPDLVHDNFDPGQDHTPAPGTQQLVVNGAGTPNTNVWCQNSIPVSPNTFYQFGTWVTSVETNSTPLAQLQFSIGGTPQGSVFSPTPTSNNWTQFTTSWYSGVSTSTSICIVNQNTSPNANDFAIDDISFIPLCSATDSITISNFPQPVITATPNDTICAGETASITASSTMSGLNYTWNPGGITSAQLSATPLITTLYSVTAVSPNGCTSNIINRTVVVRPMPVASIFINGNDTVCNGASSILDGSSTLPGSAFSWSPGPNTTNQMIVTATGPSSDYTLTVTSSFGCVDDTTVTITVIPDLQVTISGSPTICDGETAVLTASGNQPGMDFQWSTGQTGSQITVNSSNAGTISVTGDYFFCPQASDDIQVVISPNPVITVPADVEVCPGEPVFMEVSSDQPGSTFVWQPGNLTGSSNTLTVNGTTLFTVYAQNGACISDPKTFSIIASAACYLVVPNVFTPNADGNNDYFELVSHEGISTLKCSVVNRWGNTIRVFDTPDFKWDGKDESGNLVTEGVYFYTISAETKANQLLEETGMVQLVK